MKNVSVVSGNLSCKACSNKFHFSKAETYSQLGFGSCIDCSATNAKTNAGDGLMIFLVATIGCINV